MEIDQNLIFNFASIVATLLFVSATVITIFRRLKLRWPVKVNCWFCNNYTKIHRSELDWWHCPSCEQYNGFTKDGDYAYDIPEQSTQRPKNFAKPLSKSRKFNRHSAENNLCERCNRNEELKIIELRAFEPKGFFNSGLEIFKQQLEVKYPLCDDCNILVQKVLQKQSMWLTRYKMLFYKQKSVRTIINNAEKLDKVVRMFLTMLTSAFMCYPNYWQLPFLGVFLQSSVFVMNRTHRSLNALLTILWICISLVGPLNKIDLSLLYESSNWQPLENLTEQHFASILTLIIGFTNISSRYRNTRRFKATFKKLESPDGKQNFRSALNDSFEDFGSKSEINESQNYLNYHPSPTNDLENTFQNNSTLDSREYEEQRTESPAPPSNDTSQNYLETGSRHVLKFEGNSEQYSLNDSLTTLKTLTLGEPRSVKTARIPSIFRTKVYGSTSPDLFHRTKKSTRKFILAAPKLKSFAQTSWVAGGYWQVGVDSPSLSRSSSQSSGFGSAGSNFGPSREPSVTKEIDKCSVISDNTQYCYAPRPSSVNSCCQHVTPIQFARCENSLYNQPLKILPNSIYLQNSQSHFSPVHPESNICYEPCLSLKNGNINSSAIQQDQQSSNCHSVSNTTVWLTILLGGSLVFNIAVFFTIILR